MVLVASNFKLFNALIFLTRQNFLLKVFVLGRSRQENEGGKALAEVFKKMGSLEELVMPQVNFFHCSMSNK